MTSKEELEQMEKIDISKLNISGLVDIQSVTIDTSLPINERLEKYIQDIKNPYVHTCCGRRIKVSFTEGKTLKQAVKDMLIQLRE